MSRSPAELLAICHRCPHVGSPAGGVMPCLADPERRRILHHAEAGICPKGRFDQPSPLVQPPAPAPQPIPMATADQVEARRSVCEGCEHAIRLMGTVEECRICGCSLPAKLRLAASSCPLKKWEAVSGVV